MPLPSDWGNNIFDSKLISAIKQAEGLRLKAYKDTEGLWTVGYGHLLDQTKDWEGQSCTNEQADAWFMADLKHAREEVLKLGLSGIDGVRMSALIELMFNLGPTRLLKFHRMWNAIESRDWSEAKKELLASKWAVQVGTGRSERIAGWLETGMWT